MGLLKNRAHEKIIDAQNQYGELLEKALEEMADAFICKTDGSYFSVIHEFERQGYHLSEQEKESIKRITSPSDGLLDGADDESVDSTADSFPIVSKEIIDALAESENDINDSVFASSKIDYRKNEEEMITVEPDNKTIHEIIEAIKTEW